MCMHRFIAEKHQQAVMRPHRTLLQHLCMKVPDKAEYRSKLSEVKINNAGNSIDL